MEMTGERQIAAKRLKVWEALNDPDVLKACIPGCDEIEQQSPTAMTARATVKIGPISAKFSGQLTLSDLDPPNGYKIVGEGKGGAAGFAKGGAEVRLADRDSGTHLTYVVNAQVGGKMAQIGARLIDATAKSIAEQFFAKFVHQLEAVADLETPPAAPSVERPPSVLNRIVTAIKQWLGRQA
jgi:carbon monoxide dehydrogenase subunit G